MSNSWSKTYYNEIKYILHSYKKEEGCCRPLQNRSKKANSLNGLFGSGDK